MRISFHTLGCKLNFAETSALGKELIARGHTKVAQTDNADVCIINTCSVTDAADHKGRQAIHRLRRQNPNAIIIVTGCYAQLKPQEISQMPEVDYVLGMNEKFSIPDFVASLEQQHELNNVYVSAIRAINEFHPSYSKDDRTRCFLKVQDGCNYFCTYCTIPYARGKSRNASIAHTTEQARQALQAGAKELVLTGVNIGDFGRTTGESFIDLLRSIDSIDGDFRVRISSCEPNLLTDEIIQFVASSRHFAPHFHIPLQSGSNEMLRIMNRRYTRELFQERVERIKQLMPNAFIGVDCMVGVRGETPEYFEDYLAFLKRLKVSQLHVFTYSERQGTKMLQMPLLVVDPKEKKRRSDVLHQLSEEKLAIFYKEHAGEKATVLWESKKEGNQMSGFTENYIKVYRLYDKSKVNTFQQIII